MPDQSIGGNEGRDGSQDDAEERDDELRCVPTEFNWLAAQRDSLLLCFVVMAVLGHELRRSAQPPVQDLVLQFPHDRDYSRITLRHSRIELRCSATRFTVELGVLRWPTSSRDMPYMHPVHYCRRLCRPLTGE